MIPFRYLMPAVLILLLLVSGSAFSTVAKAPASGNYRSTRICTVAQKSKEFYKVRAIKSDNGSDAAFHLQRHHGNAGFSGRSYGGLLPPGYDWQPRGVLPQLVSLAMQARLACISPAQRLSLYPKHGFW